MKFQEWVKLPTSWINEEGLKKLRWNSKEGSNNISGLMLLMVIAHHADKNGISKITYDAFTHITDLSRVKVAGGLTVLENLSVIEREPDGQSTYRIIGYNDNGGWGKLPAKGLYTSGKISAFHGHFQLRKPVELDAIKLYFLFVARRDNKTNLANIGYNKIEEYSGIKRNNIKRAISFLITLDFLHVESMKSKSNGVFHAYRLVFLESRHHMGTQGRNFNQDVLGVEQNSKERIA